MNEASSASFTVYPNPVSNKVALQFAKELNGSYQVEVNSVSGQTIYRRNVQLKNVSNLQFEMGTTPPSGVYYLKITEAKTRLSYTNKLIVRR